jgi:threonine dehydrogenase-like Zn-dependent dehydrogenase
MRAVVWKDIGEIAVEEVPDPKIEQPTDAIVRLTASAICGTDLHMIRGTLTGMSKGRVLGHEGVGVIEELGPEVRNFSVGDRVVIPSTIACGNCSYCRAGYYAQCDRANPKGPRAGTAFYGGPDDSGGYQGLQAERARVPFAHANLVRLPDEISDDQAILLSDIFPTGYQAADQAEIKRGNTVAVFGCGPVGQFAIASAKLLGAGRVFAVDEVASRLAMARAQNAEIIDFGKEDPVATILRLTDGIGVDRAIDAVGVDAQRPHRGPAAQKLAAQAAELDAEQRQVAPQARPRGDNWHPGDAPSLALRWATQSLAKAGTLSIIGVYGLQANVFPIGAAMNANLTIKMGNCNHRAYIPRLIDLILARAIDPAQIVTQHQPLSGAIEAYQSFDRREESWIKVELEPAH